MSDEEYDTRLKALMEKLIPKGRADQTETKEMFLLYNYRFTPRENGTGCAACRQRVFKRLKKYYDGKN